MASKYVVSIACENGDEAILAVINVLRGMREDLSKIASKLKGERSKHERLERLPGILRNEQIEKQLQKTKFLTNNPIYDFDKNETWIFKKATGEESAIRNRIKRLSELCPGDVIHI